MLLAALCSCSVAGCRTRLGEPLGSDGVTATTPDSCTSATATWSIEHVDTLGTRPSEFGPLGTTTSLAATGDDAAIVYGNTTSVHTDGVHLATRSASGWATQIVEPAPESGYWAGVRLDDAGRRVIVDVGSEFHIHVHLPGGTDAQLVPDSSVRDPALALDEHGQPRVAFDSDIGAVEYASWDGAAWSHEVVATGITDFAVLALDATGRPSIAFCRNARLEFARRGDDGTWSVETIDDASTAKLWWPSLAIDASGRPHVSYVDQASWTLKHAMRDDGGWHLQTVGCVHDVVATSLALDAAGEPHIAVGHRTIHYPSTALLPAPLDYARHDDGGWTIETVGGQDAEEPSLVLGSDGIARVSWFDVASGALFYAVRR
jgi:hypothetical protein